MFKRARFGGRAAWGLLALAAIACKDPVDRAAKQRIFSPEDPPKVVASANEALAADSLEGDSALTRRVLGMGAAEATERLGAHKYHASVSFAWTGKSGAVKLQESRTLLAAKGGVNGDFEAALQNSRDQGLEVVRSAGQVFARDRYGKFRQRLRDRGMAEREREEVFGAVRDFDALFDGRLVLSRPERIDYEGRQAIRYRVALGPAEAKPAEAELPRVPAAKDGVDPSTRRHLAFSETKQLVSASGTVAFDEKTAVPLWAKLEGSIRVPDSAAASGASLEMNVEAAITEIGTEPKISAPKEFLADADKPQGIADALDRFGIPRQGRDRADAGTSAEPEDDETP
jgi:hypothetical protein